MPISISSFLLLLNRYACSSMAGKTNEELIMLHHIKQEFVSPRHHLNQVSRSGLIAYLSLNPSVDYMIELNQKHSFPFYKYKQRHA